VENENEFMKGVSSLFIYTLRLLSDEKLTTPTPSRPGTPGPVPPTPANSPTQPGKGDPKPTKSTEIDNEESIILNNSLNLDESPIANPIITKNILKSSINKEEESSKETPPNSEDESDVKSLESTLSDNSNIIKYVHEGLGGGNNNPEDNDPHKPRGN
jgi:hypothetical protein